MGVGGCTLRRFCYRDTTTEDLAAALVPARSCLDSMLRDKVFVCLVLLGVPWMWATCAPSVTCWGRVLRWTTTTREFKVALHLLCDTEITPWDSCCICS
jgi:hypothetical protein